MIEYKILKEDYERYKNDWLNRPSLESTRKYFSGFKRMRKEQMFDKELLDLEKVYLNTIENLNDEVDECLPHLIHEMKQFLSSYEKLQMVLEKYSVLRVKLGKDKREMNNVFDFKKK